MYEDRKKERKKNAKKDWIIDTWGKPFDEEEQTPPPPIPPVDQRIVVPGIGAPRTQANVNPQGWENRIKEAQARLDAAKAALGDKNDTRSTLQKALALKEMEREVRNAKKDSPGVPTQEVIDIAKDSENTIAPDGQVFKKGQNYSTGRIYKNEETGNLEYKKFAAVPTSQVLKGLAIPWGGAIPPIPEDPNQGATPGEKEPWYKAFGEGLMDPVNNLVIGGMNLFNPDPNTAFVPSRSTLRPELQNEYPYMGGSIAGNLALAVPGANIAGTAARGIGLGAGTANVAAGALTGAAMTAPGAYNQAASKAMTPGEAITSTVLGGVGGGTASAIGGALAKKGVGLTTNLAGQAAGDFGVGFGTPFVQAAVNNNELPTIKTAAIQGGVNALTGVGIGTATVFGTGLSNLLNGQKRSNAKAAANNAAAAEVNAQKAAASAEEAKTQTQATAYGQTAATFAKGAGGGDLNAVIGVAPGASPAEAYNTLVGFVQSATNGTVPNRPTEVVKTIKNVMQNGAEPGSKMYQDIVAGNIEGYNLDIVSKTQEKYNSDLATKVKVETTAQLPRIISDAYTTLQQAGIQDLNPNQAIAVAQILTGGKISNAEVAQKKILEYAVGNKSTQSIADGVAAAAGRAQLQSELKTQQAQQSLEQKANTAASKQKEKEGKVAEQNTKALLSNLGVPMPKGADQNLIWQNVAAIYNKDGRFADLNAFVGFAGKTLNDAQSRVGEMGDAEMSDLLLRGVGKVGRLPEIELRNKIAEDMLRTGATADEAVDAIRTQKTPAEQKEAADTQKAAQTGGKTTQPVTSGMIGGGNPGMIYEGGTPPPKSGDYTPGLEAAPVDAPVTVPEAPQVTPHTQALVKSGDGYTVGAPLTGRSQGSLSQLQKTIAATGGQEAVDAIINDSNLQSGLIAVSELQPAVLNKLGAEMGWDFTGMNDSQKRAFVLNEGIKTAEGILDVGEVVKGFGSKAKDVEQESINRSIISGKPIDLDATFGTRKNKPWEKFGIDSSTGTFSQGGKLWTPNSIAIKSAIELNVAPTLKEGAVAGALAGTGGLAGEAAKATKDLRKRTGDKSLTITQLDLAAAYNEAKKKGLIDDTPKHGATSTAKAPLGTQGVHKGLDFNGIKDTSKPSEEGWTPELEADIDAKFDLRFGKIDDPTNRKAVNEAIVNLHNDIEKMFGGLGPDWVYNRTGALLKQFEQKKNSSQQTDTPAGQSSEPTPEITKVDAISPSKYFKASPGAKSVVFKDTSQGSVVDMDAVKSDMPLAYEFLSKHRDANKFTPIDVKNALASAYKRRMRYKVDAENLIAQIRELEVLASQADAGAKTSKDDFKKQMADSRDFTPEQLELYSAMIDGLNTSHMPDYVAGASGDNYYSFATNELVSKEPDVFLHEIGHFSFYNILSPEDRIAYMEYMVDTSYGKNGKSLYGKNGKSLGERLALTSEKITENIDGKETTLIANVGDNFSEYFAEQFRQWYVGEKVTPKEFDNIFAKVADYMRRVLEKLKSGEYIDKNLVLYFEKISPPKPKRTKSRPGVVNSVVNSQSPDITTVEGKNAPRGNVEVPKNTQEYIRKLENAKSAWLADNETKLADAKEKMDDAWMVSGDRVKYMEAREGYYKLKNELGDLNPTDLAALTQKLSDIANNKKFPSGRRLGAEVGLYLIDTNPALYKDISLHIAALADGITGNWNPLDKEIKISRNSTGKLSIPHELLHSVERFLPLDLRARIYDEWWEHLNWYIDSSNPPKYELRTLEKLRDSYINGGGYREASDIFDATGGLVPYELISPKEWFTVNGTDLIFTKKKGEDGAPKGMSAALRAKIVEFFNGLADAIRTTIQKWTNSTVRPEGTIPLKEIKTYEAVLEALEFITNPKNTPEEEGYGIPQSYHERNDDLASLEGGEVFSKAPSQKDNLSTAINILGAGIGAYSLYHALAFGGGDVGSLALLGAGLNSDMVKKGLGGLKQKTSDWIKSYNLKGDSINSAYNTWVQNNSYADEAAKKQALSDIKEQSALRLEGLPNMAFDLNPFHQIAAKNSILGGIRDKGFEMEKHFSDMSTILDDINTWIKKTQQDLVSEVVKLNSDVYNANAAINNDNSIPKDQKAEAKEEATSALLSEAFAKNPELQAEYEKWRNMINEASALQIELQMLNDISAVPSTLDARIDDFTKVADELQFQADDFSSYANNIGKMLRTDKAGAFDKLLVNDMEFRTLYSGKKTVRKKNRKTGVVTEEELDDKNKILIVKKHQKEQRKKANALRRKQRATERMANYHEELEKRKAQSVADHHINLWRAYQAAQRKKMFFGKGRDLQSATLQLRGADGKRYRIYGNNKKSVVEQTASIAGKEGLVMEVEGFALSPTATVDQLSKGWMPKGAIFKDSDGNVWDFNQFAAAHDDYTNTLWSAIDLVTAGIAESKLAKVTAEWLKNNPEQAGDSGELKALRSKITEAAEGRIDAEELRTNLLVMQAQQATEPPKTSTLMPPGTEDGNLAQHIASGLHDLQNDAYRTGRAVGTREQLMTDALEGWDDKLNSYLRRQQEQLATRAAVPFGRNLLTEGMNSLTSASQLLLLALRPATFAVNLVKGTTMSASEFGLGDVMRQLPGFKIDGFNAAWEHAKKTVDTQTANRYYVGEADRGGWVKSVLRGSTAWSQAIADKVTARTATADFVANLSDADAKLLAGGDKGMLRKLDNHVLNSIAMTQGRYQHYDLSPVHQQILRFPMGRAALAFTLPRINELSWVWQNAKNMKDRKSQAKLLRYGMLTAMTVGGLGLPLVADLMSALNSGTGDREELATDKAIADLRKLAIENGVDGETFDNIRKFGAKGAPGALLDTELMSDEETSSLLTMFMVENLIKVGKNIAGNLTDEEKTAAEKILAITEGSMPQLKAVRRTATEASTGTKTDSKGDLIPGSSTDAGRMTQIFLGLGSHTDRQAQKRLKNTDLVTEQGLNKAAENFLDDLQGMSQIIYAGKIINSSKKEANADRRDELFKHITKNKEELRNVIRTANELTEQAEEKIKEAGEKLKSWLKTPVSEVKGLPKRVVEQGGTVEEAMNRTLAISRNPSYNSTKGVVKRMVGSMEDEKYSETSLYGFYRKKAIIEAVNNSKLGVKAYFNPTTKLESGGRLKNVPDAEQAFEYGKNRVISLLQGQVLPE